MACEDLDKEKEKKGFRRQMQTDKEESVCIYIYIGRARNGVDRYRDIYFILEE